MDREHPFYPSSAPFVPFARRFEAASPLLTFETPPQTPRIPFSSTRISSPSFRPSSRGQTLPRHRSSPSLSPSPPSSLPALVGSRQPFTDHRPRLSMSSLDPSKQIASDPTPANLLRLTPLLSNPPPLLAGFASPFPSLSTSTLRRFDLDSYKRQGVEAIKALAVRLKEDHDGRGWFLGCS